MDFFDIMRVVFDNLLKLFGLRIRLGFFNFTIGSMFVGLFIISCSLALLKYLFGSDD